MVFEEFATKLAIIQANNHLDIETTMYIKRSVVGTKKLWDCSEEELDKILFEYRKEYKKRKYYEKVTYIKKSDRKTKHKYTKRKDWD